MPRCPTSGMHTGTFVSLSAQTTNLGSFELHILRGTLVCEFDNIGAAVVNAFIGGYHWRARTLKTPKRCRFLDNCMCAYAIGSLVDLQITRVRA